MEQITDSFSSGSKDSQKLKTIWAGYIYQGYR